MPVLFTVTSLITLTAKPSTDLRRNAMVVDALTRAVDFCNLDNIPGCIREVLETEAWAKRMKAGHLFEHKRFIDFITEPPLAGCGWNPTNVEALLAKADDGGQVLVMWRQAITPSRGQPKKGERKNDNIIYSQGTSRAYTLDRLQRDHPEIYKRVIAGKLSANAAAIEAGFRTKPTPYDRNKYDRNKQKVTCPRCGQNAWGKPNLAINCRPCGLPMLAAEVADDGVEIAND
jgi:hypothetical protein